LDVRDEFPDSNLAELYNPNTMPPRLVIAHRELDRAVDKCFRANPFNTELERLEFLFNLYERYTQTIELEN
jgi:hypothetical protein